MWLLGYKWGYEQAIPKNIKGERVFFPKGFHCLVIVLFFLIFLLFYLVKSRVILLNIPEWLLEYGGWFIGIIFLLRGIGDFKYVGAFKTIKHSDFSRLDSKIYSPLCFLISLIAIAIEFIN